MLKKNAANVLTIFRFLLIPVFVYIYMFSNLENASVVAAIILATAFVTDVLDGYIARKYNQITDWGKVMDPLADKLVQVIALLCIIIKNPSVEFMLVIIFIGIKELLMVTGGAYLYGRGHTVSANWFGKVATFVNIMCIFAVLIFTKNHSWYIIALVLMVIANALAFTSYVFKFKELSGIWNKK